MKKGIKALKYITLFIALLFIFSSCTKQNDAINTDLNTPAETSSLVTSEDNQPEHSENSYTSPASDNPIKISTSENSPSEFPENVFENFDPWDDDYISPVSDNPMAICNLFPDPFFAVEIARLFHKNNVTDSVTFEELAKYAGGINCSPGLLKNVEGIGYLTGLTSFSSGKNNLKELPPEIGKLINLKAINLLKAYNFERFPPEIENLKNLEVLRVDLTSLEEIPKEIGGLLNLKILMVDNTKITSIPDEIGNLENLLLFDAHNNNINSIPDSLCNSINLLSLDLSRTNIESLPKELGNLKELQRLDLFGCDLKELPESIKSLEKLRYLNVYDNYSLNEKYKNWFYQDVYMCKYDPEHDIYQQIGLMNW